MAFKQNELPAPQPEPLGTQVNPSSATDVAFFTDALMNEAYGREVSTETMKSGFDEIYTDLTERGYSQAYSNAKQVWEDEQSVESKVLVGELMMDNTIDKATKINMINQYTSSGYINPDIKYKYAREVASIDNSSTYLERDAQDVVVDDVNNQLAISEKERQDEDTSNIIEKAAGEVVSLFNVAAMAIGGTVDFVYRTKKAMDMYKERGQVDWVEISSMSENLDEDSALKKTINFSAEPLAKALGLNDEMQESLVTTGVTKIGEGFEWLAEKIAEKQILGITSKEEAMYAIEALGFVIPAGFAAKSALKRIGHKPGGGLDTTMKSNPKTGGDLAAEVVKEKGDSTAKKVNSSKGAAVKENMLPDADDGTPVQNVKPDINERIEKSMAELDTNDRLLLELMYDDNLVKKEYRLMDFERRTNVAKATGLTQNLASSRYNITGNLLEGKQVFTQGTDYPYTSKKAILDAADKLETQIADMRKVEADVDKKAGIDTSKYNVKNDIKIRDIKSGQLFSIDEFKQTKLDGRKFQLEYNFRKEYDFLADSMLGEKFSNVEVSSMLFGKKLGTYLNRTFLGEHLFGTGFTAKWFEKARADLGPKAGRITKELTQEFNSLIRQNTKIRKEAYSVIQMQSKYKRDHISKARLRMAFRDLSEAQINKLDDIQKSWRKTQDTLYEITNQGEKTRLIDSKYDKGAFINGEYVGAVKQALNDSDFRGVDMDTLTVYDPQSKSFKLFERNGNRTDGYYDKDGRKLVKMEARNRQEVYNLDNKNSSDYMLLKDTEIDLLPERVLPKMKGHAHREYKSNFFVDVIPKTVVLNGKTISAYKAPGVLDEQAVAVLRDKFQQTKGTSTTRNGADTLAKQLGEDLGDDYIVLNPRNASADNIRDFTAEYRLQHDDYKNAVSRVEDMRILQGDDVIVDPMHAMNNAANRTVRTAAYSQFDKVFKEAFVRDFKDVLKDGEFPTSLDDIRVSAIAGEGARLNKLAAEAKALWNRQMHFQGNSINKADQIFQTGMHSLADVFEKVKVDKAAVASRRIGDVGLTGVSGQAKRAASLLMITFNNPIRHWIIQPMMFYEQSIIFPKTFAKTMKQTPAMMMALLDEGSPILKGESSKLLNMYSKAERAEIVKTAKILKKEGILESIDQNLAVQEIMKGHIKKLEPTKTMSGKLGEQLTGAFEGTRHVFNKFGFASGELTNRVGLWLQNKERWIADPKNKGKNWADPRNVKDISFEAWKQSGAMTSSGALAFQRMPVLSFLTQFQSINMKGFMNILQDNATNLTRADRVKLTANRIAMHGVEYGVPLGGGAYLLDYFLKSDDPQVNQYAEELSRGYLDRFTNMLMSTISGEPSDITLSESASINAQNAYADILSGVWDIGRFIGGARDVQAPNIPSVKAGGRVLEKIQQVSDMWKFNPVTPELLVDSVATLSEVTSMGSNMFKMTQMLAYDDIVSNYGRKKGIDTTLTDAVAKSAGFNTRMEARQRVQKELQRDIETRIKEATDEYDRMIRNNLKKNPEGNFMKYINMSMSMLEQQGIFSGTEMDRIINGVIKRHNDSFKNNETDNLINWVRQSDSQSPDMQKLISLFASHPDPLVRETAEFLKGKPQKQLFNEE